MGRVLVKVRGKEVCGISEEEPGGQLARMERLRVEVGGGDLRGTDAGGTWEGSENGTSTGLGRMTWCLALRRRVSFWVEGRGVGGGLEGDDKGLGWRSAMERLWIWCWGRFSVVVGGEAAGD